MYVHVFSRVSTLPLIVVEGPLQFGSKWIRTILVPGCLVFLLLEDCLAQTRLHYMSVSARRKRMLLHMSAAKKPIWFIPGFTAVFHGNHWHVDEIRLLGYWTCNDGWCMWSLGLSPYAGAAPTCIITVDLSLHTQVTQKLCKPFRHVRRWLEPLGHPSASCVPQSHGYAMMCRQIRPHKGCRVWPGSVSQTIQNLDTCWYLSNYLDISWYELR